MSYAFDPHKYPKKLVSSYWFSSASAETQRGLPPQPPVRKQGLMVPYCFPVDTFPPL